MARNALKSNSGGAADWVIDSFKRGLNTLVSDTRLKPEESPDLNNVFLTEDGLPSKMTGHSQVGDTKSYMSRVRGVASYYVTGATDYLFMAGATQVFYRDHTSGNFTAIAGVSIPNDTAVNFVQARGKLYLHSKTGPMQAVYALGATNPANGVSAEFGIYWKGRHIVAGNTTNTSRVYGSRSTDASYFITTGTDSAGNDAFWFDVSPDDGDRVTGLAIFQDNLVVFKERSIYRAVPSNSVSGDFISKVEVVSKSIGCVAHRTIESVENDIYFLSRRGVTILGNEPNFFDSIRTNELSAQIHDQIDGITASNFTLPSAIYHNYRYRLSIPFGGVTSNNRELLMDTRYGGWTKSTGRNINCYTTFVDPSDKAEKLYVGDDTTGKVYRADSTNGFDGSAISSYYRTATVDMSHPELTKFFRDVDIQFRNTSATLTLDVYVDGEVFKSRTVSVGTSGLSNGIGVNTIDENVIGLEGTATSSTVTSNVIYRIPLRKRGKNIAVKVSESSSGDNWTMMSVRGTYRPLSHNVFSSTYKL